MRKNRREYKSKSSNLGKARIAALEKRMDEQIDDLDSEKSLSPLPLPTIDVDTSTNSKVQHYEELVKQLRDNTYTVFDLDSTTGVKRSRDESAHTLPRDINIDWAIIQSRSLLLQHKGSKQYEAPVHSDKSFCYFIINVFIVFRFFGLLNWFAVLYFSSCWNGKK